MPGTEETLAPGTGTGTGASGEIGRHAGFRFLCLRAWGFKSPLAHIEEVPRSLTGALPVFSQDSGP